MNEEQILARLRDNSPADRLLEECRHPTQPLGSGDVYREFTRKLLEQGFPTLALDLAKEGQEYLQADVQLQYLLALAARRGGNAKYAASLLEPILPQAIDLSLDLAIALRVDIIALQGGILKILSRTSPELLVQAAQWYERAALLPGATDLPDAGTFPLINAATVFRLLGQEERSRKLATEVIERIGKIDVSKGDPVWIPATLGEANVLLESHESATKHYLQAVNAAIAQNRLGEMASIRTNIELLRVAGVTADSKFLDEHLGSVVIFSGHMIDSPERIRAGHPLRFPNSPPLIDAVSRSIESLLESLNAKVGFCSLACGGDLLFAKEMLARNAELHVVLPFAEHDFLRTSVNFGQSTEAWRRWTAMFHEVLGKVPEINIHYTTKEPYLGSGDLFHFSNRVSQGLAVIRARERAACPQAILLLDKAMPGQPGGARSFGAAWNTIGDVPHEIDLESLRAQLDHSSYSSFPVLPPAAPTASCRLNRPVKALMFADVAGFSRIPEWQLADFLEDYGRFLHELFISPIGVAAIYANTWGDGIYAVFDRVSDAAAFALELVEPRITPPDWQKYDLGSSSPFRVGLHTGPVFELPDMFQGRSAFSGQHVSRAARIEPATMRGCAYASESFAALLTVEGAPDFHIEGVGTHGLAKGYDRCKLYRIARGTEASAAGQEHPVVSSFEE